MSWFKRGGRRSPTTMGRESSDIDPNTCLEVFQNHWKQVCVVISGQDKRISGQDKRLTTAVGPATLDGVEAVLSNMEQMVTLLFEEHDDGGWPGPILQYTMEKDLLEEFCSWCSQNVGSHDRLRLQQLRLFELLISQSRQLLLVHRPIIRPLLRLLIDVSESQDLVNNVELEFKLVLVLHQICICISQQSLILESFFSTDTDHGPTRFLIFSLLIPYIHREGPVGQKARDALLLIMTLSARHPHIGHYIANHSHFCPVLATGLSALYSSLPRRLTPPTEDWLCITNEDCQRIPELQMFLNSLEFSNAVVQIAHPSVRDQLIEFIYTGFLVPVLAPALHQDIPGLPIPLLDTDLFRISREEVMTATAYLDLFVRHVTDPSLLKAVLKFVMTQKYDDVTILDTLLTRIQSSTSLSSVTLSLFNTLIDLNCEDVMFQLVFRYLVPCTHVMVSQRRSVRDVDLYGKSAEKFLSLRPSCCTEKSHSINSINDSQSSNLSQGVTSATSSSSIPAGLMALVESNYLDYLHDARHILVYCAHACAQWRYRYDGEDPPPDCLPITYSQKTVSPGSDNEDSMDDSKGDKEQPSPPPTGYIELGSMMGSLDGDKAVTAGKDSCEQENKNNQTSTIVKQDSCVFMPSENENEKCNIGEEEKDVSVRKDISPDAKLYSSLETLDAFLSYLMKTDDGLGEEIDFENGEKSASAAALCLEEVLKEVQLSHFDPKGKAEERKVHYQDDQSLDSAVDLASLSPISKKTPSCSRDSKSSVISDSEIPINDLTGLSVGSLAATTGLVTNTNKTVAWEELTVADAPTEPKIKVNSLHGTESSGFVNISIVPEKTTSSDGQEQVTQDTSSYATATPSVQISATSSITPAAPASPLMSQKSRNIPKDFPVGLKSNAFLASTPLFSPSSKSPLTPLTPGEELPSSFQSNSLTKKQLTYLTDPPNIGPFLSVLLSRVEGMAGNSLYFNLLLTGVISRLAAYPQPLLRSFLLNHNLVFQPSVKSLAQVLSSLRQKLESYSHTVKEFDQLIASARQNLAQRELLIIFPQSHPHLKGLPPPPSLLGDDGRLNNHFSLYPNPQQQQQQIPTGDKQLAPGQNVREKKKASIADIFRRSPAKEKMASKKRSMSLLQRIQSPGSEGYRYVNHNEDRLGGEGESTSSAGGRVAAQSLSTWNAVYCFIVLDEFLKELSALSLEHSLLLADDGYTSS